RSTARTGSFEMKRSFASWGGGETARFFDKVELRRGAESPDSCVMPACVGHDISASAGQPSVNTFGPWYNSAISSGRHIRSYRPGMQAGLGLPDHQPRPHPLNRNPRLGVCHSLERLYTPTPEKSGRGGYATPAKLDSLLSMSGSIL